MAAATPPRIVCLLSGPLAAVGAASQPGVEGELRSLPLLDLEAERRNLESALREGCGDTGRGVELQIRYATLDALRSAVTLGARVVHFSGHGHPSFLCFEDGRGGAAAASPEQLRRLVSAGGCDSVRLVVVNSCHSHRAGYAFVNAGVPHVVAVSRRANNDGRVSDRAATAFCRAFYLGVIAGRTVREAFEIGCASASGSFSGDKTYVLLPEDGAHDEPVLSDAPRGLLRVVEPRRAPSNAPAVPTYYLGRDAELFCLVDSMIRHRLTSVTGSFGSGKSALAAAAAHYLADRGHYFEAVVWVRVASRERLVDDVVDAARRVLAAPPTDEDDQPEYSSRRRDTASSTLGQPPKLVRSVTLRRRDSLDCDSVVDRVTSFSSLVGGGDDDDLGGAARSKTSAAAFLRHRRVLLVLDNLDAIAASDNSALADARRALSSLLSTASKAHVVVTCSRGAGLGRSTSVTERIIKVGPLEPAHAARLLLHRSPELARRATNAKAARSPREPPHALVAATAAHPALRRLAGNPFAIALSATLLNALFELEDAADRAAAAAAAANLPRRVPPSTSDPEVRADRPSFPPRAKSTPADDAVAANNLEPLDRLLAVLDSYGPADDDVARLRDEINYVTAQPPLDDPLDTAHILHVPSDDHRGHHLHRRATRHPNQLPPTPRHHHHHHHQQQHNHRGDPHRRVLDSRTFEILATALAVAWLARLVFDACAAQRAAFSLRLDEVAHLFVDIALLVVLASLLPVPSPPDAADDDKRRPAR